MSTVIDSTFHACCNAIGGHADGCQAADRRTRLISETRHLIQQVDTRALTTDELHDFVLLLRCFLPQPAGSVVVQR
ncbi:hypothetical protein [Gordonia sp. ABSL49_1]|uniref:hypothetical protein n=1 Tax=Gordonia sp. ABSL49_1 TaxID=2920941 RepID=UPI001F0F33A2|nr:hypothetical protein [Gordonia sp. ABSL49_1]MCH5645572.1 hypothetical protein [Gordonia sp. ABSL49_1]